MTRHRQNIKLTHTNNQRSQGGQRYLSDLTLFFSLFLSWLCPSTAGNSPQSKFSDFLRPLLSLSIPLPVALQCHLVKLIPHIHLPFSHLMGHKILLVHVEGSQSEWCISSMISRVFDQNGVSLLYIMLEIHYSGWKPSVYSRDTPFWLETLDLLSISSPCAKIASVQFDGHGGPPDPSKAL